MTNVVVDLTERIASAFVLLSNHELGGVGVIVMRMIWMTFPQTQSGAGSPPKIVSDTLSTCSPG